MSRQWYLLDCQDGDYKDAPTDSFQTESSDALEQILSSPLAENVEIVNHDLTERISIKAVIQGRVQDTQLNSLQRKILAPLNSFKAGQYVYYKNRYWLIIGLVDDNSFYEKGVMILCNHLLTWENTEGEIIQRWSNLTSGSQYNHGESGTENYEFRTDQLLVLIPNDEESILLEHGHRFIIDKRCKIYEKHFSPDTVTDTSNKVITYEVSRVENLLFDYGDSGYVQLMVYQDEQHENDGYYIVNGNGYWLCGKSSTINTGNSRYKIGYDEPVVYCEIDPTMFWIDNVGEMDGVPQWNIVCDFSSELNIQEIDNTIHISANDKKLIGKSFILKLSVNGIEHDSISVKIKAF